MQYYVYFAQSTKNGKIYVGHTSKTPEQRIYEHNTKSNKFTRQNGPFILIYYEKYHCLKDAQSRENFYKTGFGKKIKKLIALNLNKLNKDS